MLVSVSDKVSAISRYDQTLLFQHQAASQRFFYQTQRAMNFVRLFALFEFFFRRQIRYIIRFFDVIFFARVGSDVGSQSISRHIQCTRISHGRSISPSAIESKL